MSQLYNLPYRFGLETQSRQTQTQLQKRRRRKSANAHANAQPLASMTQQRSAVRPAACGITGDHCDKRQAYSSPRRLLSLLSQ